ncbi:MAG TPA: hypothetical protein VG900_00115 [Hyphomicrobiaceae bacterium]|jgi:hypothetical protein|nr:hypothetical protein [Hyphomicrobiaceae bacterium]
MAPRLPDRHPSLYLLTDHLDAALAMGEDLLTEKVALADPTQQITTPRIARLNRELADFIAAVHALELAMTARLLQARKRAEELKTREPRLRPLISLFVAGTGALAAAAAELGDTRSREFETGDTQTSFLRSRGLLARDVAGLERLTQLAVSEDYLVAGRVRLGTLLDLTATFLDTLDLLYDLYADAEADEGVTPPPMQTPPPSESGRLG